MKIAILSESPADEAALKILVEALLGEPIDSYQPHLRSRGYPAILNVLPAVLKDLHFQRTAEALVAVVDSDQSPVHQPDHDPNETAECRACRLISLIDNTLAQLTPLENWSPIRTAVAVPTPAIEAWFLFQHDSDCTEANWKQKQAEGTHARGEILRLKRLAYGTDRPNLALEIQCARDHAARLAQGLDDIEQYFPNSFGLLARQIREWREHSES